MSESNITKTNARVVRDYKNIEYRDETTMCDAYHLNVSTFRSRYYSLGWSLERSLTGSRRVHDFAGNEYKDEITMCRKYGIANTTYRSRMGLGWPMENALTIPPTHTNSIPCVDNTGKRFRSYQSMCKYHGISYQVFHERLVSGWSFSDALTKPLQDHTVTCFDGTVYETEAAMSEAFGIPYVNYRNRKRNGWDIERILTTPIRNRRK